ncbi:hypothetical protein MTO96_035970 [Rhipicephalus appendiculatus]
MLVMAAGAVDASDMGRCGKEMERWRLTDRAAQDVDREGRKLLSMGPVCGASGQGWGLQLDEGGGPEWLNGSLHWRKPVTWASLHKKQHGTQVRGSTVLWAWPQR